MLLLFKLCCLFWANTQKENVVLSLLRVLSIVVFGVLVLCVFVVGWYHPLGGAWCLTCEGQSQWGEDILKFTVSHVPIFRYAVDLFFFVLKHGLTTARYCAIMLIFSQFKMHPNIAVIVTGLQSGWLRNHHPVLARNKEILQNVLTGSGAHLAFYWAPRAHSLGLKWPGYEADSSTPSHAVI